MYKLIKKGAQYLMLIILLIGCDEGSGYDPIQSLAECTVEIPRDPDLMTDLLTGDWEQKAFRCPGSDDLFETNAYFMIRLNPDQTLEVWIESSIVSNHTWELILDANGDVGGIRIEPPVTRTSQNISLCLLPEPMLRFYGDNRGCDQFYQRR